MRVGIISFFHESNTFLRKSTTLEDYRRDVLCSGEAMLTHWKNTAHELGGFIEVLCGAGIEIVPIFSAWAMPAGAVDAETYTAIAGMIQEGLKQAGPMDGLLVSPHGAAVSDPHPDMDGQWLSEVRDTVGPDMPMICTLDAHVNLSPRMIEACDATLIYRTNPHTDQKPIGLKAAELMVRTVRGEIRPTQAAAFPPLMINIECQQTAIAPCRPMYEFADTMLKRSGVLANSIGLGFMYADVEEMGTSAVVVTDGDPALARKYADELGRHLWDHREDFVPKLIGIDEAIDRALAGAKPVCLLDMGDNVGGGSAADGTYLARRLHERRLPRTFVAVADPAAAAAASDAGVGASLTLAVGGKLDDQHGDPLDVVVTVKSLHDGEFEETKVRHGGRRDGHMGPTAIVETEHGLTIQLTTHRVAPFSIEQIRCCDIDPSIYDILVAKGVVAPIAAYEEVCPTIIRVNTPGSTSADIHAFTYRRRRHPLYPFEEATY